VGDAGTVTEHGYDDVDRQMPTEELPRTRFPFEDWPDKTASPHGRQPAQPTATQPTSGQLSSEQPTTPFGVVDAPDDDAREARDEQTAPRRTRKPLLAAVTGTLTATLVIMALGMIGAQLYSAGHGEAGPGGLAVGAHIAGATVAVALYRTARRPTGGVRWLACFALLGVAGILLWFFWWAA
jgi:hypothetical protein